MNCGHRNQELCALAAQVRNPHAPCRVAARTPMFTPSPPRSPPLAVLIKPKGDGRPSPFNVIWDSDSPSRSAAVPTIPLIIDFLLVIDITAGSTNYRANRRALSAADQRASQRADASARRRAPDCFASRGLGVVIIVTVSITSVIVVVVSITSVIVVVVSITSVIVVVVPGRSIITPVASVLRHRARSGGGG